MSVDICAGLTLHSRRINAYTAYQKRAAAHTRSQEKPERLSPQGKKQYRCKIEGKSRSRECARRKNAVIQTAVLFCNQHHVLESFELVCFEHQLKLYNFNLSNVVCRALEDIRWKEKIYREGNIDLCLRQEESRITRWRQFRQTERLEPEACHR